MVAMFSPTASSGTHETATLNIAYTGFAGGPQTVALDGTAGSGVVTVSPTLFNFGTVALGGNLTSTNITLTNVSGSTITLTGTTITGTNAADFTFVTNGCNTGTLTNSNACITTINFAPTQPPTTLETATLTIPYTGTTGSPKTVSLQGTVGAVPTGIPAPCVVCFTLNISGATFPPPTPMAIVPSSVQLTAKGWSADKVTFTPTLTINLTGQNFNGTPTCSFDSSFINCSCSSTSACTALLPSTVMPVPTVGTISVPHTIGIVFH